jgi:hypothetical protein
MTTQQELVDEYLNAFTEHQRFVMNVAMEKLGSSFNIAKSTGFAKWNAKRESSQQAPAPTTASTPEQTQTQSQPQDQPKKKRKLVVKCKVTPRKKQQEPVTIADKTTSLLLDNNVKQTPPLLLLQTSETPSIEHEGGSLYCIFSDTSMLYVGTTSDTKKNFRLAFRNVIKRLKEGEHTIPSALHAFIHHTEDSKQRVKLRDVIKRTFAI